MFSFFSCRRRWKVLIIFAIYFSYFNFGFSFASCLVITYFLTQTDMLSLGQSTRSVVSLPTSSILSLQTCLSTSFIFQFYNLLHCISTEFQSSILKVLSLYFGFTVVSFHLKRLPLAPSVNHFLYALQFSAFHHCTTDKFKSQVIFLH